VRIAGAIALVLTAPEILGLPLSLGCFPGPVSPDAGTTDGGAVHALDAARVDGASECAQVGPADDCAAAGARLCVLACAGSDGAPLWRTPAGTPYAAACRRARDDGRDWRPSCVAKIPTCADFDRAYRSEAWSCPW
jgi:hypothetical protein